MHKIAWTTTGMALIMIGTLVGYGVNEVFASTDGTNSSTTSSVKNEKVTKSTLIQQSEKVGKKNSNTKTSTSTNEASDGINNEEEQAFQWISKHTSLPLYMPSITNRVSKGYISVKASADSDEWSINLLNTAKKYSLNNPSIPASTSGIAFWGMVQENQSITGNNVDNILQKNNGLWNNFAQVNANQSSQSVMLGDSSDAIKGTLYPVSGSKWVNTKLIWHEGDWTIEEIGSNAKSEEQVSYNVVNYLHTHALPPHKGLLMIGLSVPSSESKVSLGAYSELDWVDQNNVFIAGASLVSKNNPIQTINMAISWKKIN